MTKVLITGVAGFVGFHLAKKLHPDFDIIGIDLIDESDSGIQADRLKELSGIIQYRKVDVCEKVELKRCFDLFQPNIVLHMAAKPGISDSLKNPEIYFKSNVDGLFNILEACREFSCKLIYASSSSVYNNEKPVFQEEDIVDNQLSFYGTTKRIDEILASNYARQFGIESVGLRFFTVYGSWVRKDMAAWKFMNALMNGDVIHLYNKGEVRRDFTHVSDIVHSINLLVDKLIEGSISKMPDIFNIGHGAPVKVLDYLNEIAFHLKKKPNVDSPPLPENELESTHSDTRKLENEIGYTPQTNLKNGVAEMVEWFLKYYPKAELQKTKND